MTTINIARNFAFNLMLAMAWILAAGCAKELDPDSGLPAPDAGSADGGGQNMPKPGVLDSTSRSSDGGQVPSFETAKDPSDCALGAMDLNEDGVIDEQDSHNNLYTCKNPQPDPPPQPVTEEPHVPCTLDRAKRENAKQWAKMEAKQEEAKERYDLLVQGLHQARDLSRRLPRVNGMIRLPYTHIKVQVATLDPYVQHYSGTTMGCVFEEDRSESQLEYREVFARNWQYLGALALLWLKEELNSDAHPLFERGTMETMNEWSWPFFPSEQVSQLSEIQFAETLPVRDENGEPTHPECEGCDDVSRRLLYISVRQDHANKFMEWVYKVLSSAAGMELLGVHIKGELFNRVLEMAWNATIQDFFDLAQTASETLRSFNVLKILAIKVWQDAGSLDDSKGGKRLMATYRFWFAKIAVLSHSRYAKAWREQVRNEMRLDQVFFKWHLRQLR